MTARARALRWFVVIVVAGGLVDIFPTWSTFWCLVLLVVAWIAGTCAGIVVDEYWPRKMHTPRDFTSHRYGERRRFR